MEKLQLAGKLANSLKVERPYSEPGIYLGTSAFTVVDCEAESAECTGRMDIQDEKLVAMLPQCPDYNKHALKSVVEYLSRLGFLLTRAQGQFTCRFAAEIRNKIWLDARFADLLRDY